MNFVFNTYEISPHSLPLILAIERLRKVDVVKYQYVRDPSDPVRAHEVVKQIGELGVKNPVNSEASKRLKSEADYLFNGERDLDEMLARVRTGKPTTYQSERWFKPVRLFAKGNGEYSRGNGLNISGFVRMLMPFGFKRAVQMMRLFRSGGPFVYLPIGLAAARDMARMCGLMNGDWRCLFRAPQLKFEPQAGGKITASDGNDKRYCTDKMRMWGYFVASSECKRCETNRHTPLRVLYIGRILGLKRVDTIIKAVSGLDDIALDVYGNGPDKENLMSLEDLSGNVKFYDFVLPKDVRECMRKHDVLVLSSNGFEGWGAVVNEALEEGMKVVGTYEAGASATILPKENLFHAGDWRALRKLLQHPEDIKDVGIGAWSVDNAAKAMMKIYEELKAESEKS